ncbi:Vacuolar protein sorting-associated protein 13 [Dioscorea alata]|uniref:Vacuolar protein sorting-associated protein 13 n=1 Tax=Dioscorea alata TaxID=55571 RepID=A0ACB7WKH8_DIOAL|nr:Vacuolar protein sorting-associated protein 13 [Dioscorea alata]
MITLHLPFVGVSLMNSSPQELVFASMKDTTILLFQSLDQQKFLFQILSLQIDNQLPDTPYPITLSFDNELRGRSSSYLKSKEHLVRVQNANISCDSALESVFHLAAARWRKTDPSLISFEYVNLWLAPFCIEFDEQILSSLLEFFRTISSRLLSQTIQNDFQLHTLEYQNGQYSLSRISKCLETRSTISLPSVAPIRAPWQHIYLFARKQKKIYVEFFELAPIKLSISFSSTPWMMRNETRAETETFIRISGASFQRGLMALIDVEDVPVHLRQLTLEHLMANKESIQEILTRHYTRQLLHEIYKVFGSAGVIGNPMGFARNVGVGIKDFLSVSSKGIVQGLTGLLQSPIKGAEKHGLPGVLSGIANGYCWTRGKTDG